MIDGGPFIEENKVIQYSFTSKLGIKYLDVINRFDTHGELNLKVIRSISQISMLYLHRELAGFPPINPSSISTPSKV
jgi:hypothetical protein